MNVDSTRKSAAQHLVEALRIHGTERLFCVPGESFLAVLDALHDEPAISTITCRHEGGAAMMAEADGKLTGRPGICMVTRGPGASNAAAGIHVAQQDSTPLIVLIGQVARGFRERGAFQEVDFKQMFGHIAKWVAEIDSPARVHEFLAGAFAMATSGRPGPVVLVLPEDMLVEYVMLPAPRRNFSIETHPHPSQIDAVRQALAAAKRPLVILGGSRWSAKACSAVERFAERNDLPVVASFRRQDLFDNDLPNYCGDLGLGPNPKLKQRVADADLLLVVAAKLGEVATAGYETVDIPTPRQNFIHVHPDAAELGRVYQPNIAINASPQAFAAALECLPPIESNAWRLWRQAARAEYEAWQQPKPVPDAFNFGEALLALRDVLPADAIITNGAGNFSAWVHRFHRYRSFGTQLAPTSGSMGYGIPAAVAAKLRHPHRPVICFAGDGDFMMSVAELATAVQHNVAAVFVVIDNGMYGTIRMHQERRYPGRVVATDLHNPDFAALGLAFGATVEVVAETSEFLPAVGRALADDRPTLIHVRLGQEAITANQSIAQIRDAARSRNA